MSERRFRVRWWHGLVVFMICLPLSGLLIAKIARETGKARYEAAVAARQAIGRPATVADLVALAPTVDPALQEAWHAWQVGYQNQKHVPEPQLSPQWERWVAGVAELPPGIRDWVEGRREIFVPARLLVRNPDLVISGYGFVVADLSQHRQGRVDTCELRFDNLLAARDFAQWLSYECVMAEDPLSALADLDALQSALNPTLTLIDALIAVSVADIRDATVFALAWRGRLPEKYRDAWLHETPTQPHWVARGMEGELCLTWGSIATSLTDGEIFRDALFAEPRWSWGGWRLWIQGYSQCSDAVIWLGAWCDRLDNRRPDVLPLPADSVLGRNVLTRFLLPNLLESALIALEAAARHRQIRLAVRLLSLSPGELPTDGTKLERHLADFTVLNAGRDALTLAYERLGPARFRLSVAPYAPSPISLSFPSPIAEMGKAVGTPASTEPFILGKSMVEISLPGTVLPDPSSSP